MSAGKCPICGKPPAASYRPFCSSRCANVDLHRWLTGVYSIPDGPEAEALPGDVDGEDEA
jgi:hypothetical protein